MSMLQPAYVLHSRRYRESSLILELLTRDAGRVGVLARGAAGGKKAWQNLLQPFVPLMMAWRGRGELPLLTGLEAASAAPGLNGTALYCGFYVNELLLKLTQRGEAHSELFTLYACCMQNLFEAGSQREPLESALRRFELQLLEELGLGLLLTEDSQGEAIDPSGHYRYDYQAGPIPATADTLQAVRGATLLALSRGEYASLQERREARLLMRELLHHHLGGQRLVSRELFRNG